MSVLGRQKLLKEPDHPLRRGGQGPASAAPRTRIKDITPISERPAEADALAAAVTPPPCHL